MPMLPRLRTGIALLLVAFAIWIHFYSLGSSRVEWQYSSGFFPSFAGRLRAFTGDIPFSIGDILYGLAAAWLVYKAVRLLIRLKNRRKNPIKRNEAMGKLVNAILIIASLYIIFNVFWGINYNRKGIAWQMGLQMENYSLQDVKNLNENLVEKINSAREKITAVRPRYATRQQLFNEVANAYKLAAEEYPFLAYEPVSLKSSMWGWLGNYTGFTGYYNPFTGEAQINTSVPGFLQPFIGCHEVAHQLGYAKEMEANFVGYLAASASPDTLMQYSVYLDLFMYANRNLSYTDSACALEVRNTLDSAVVNDLITWKQFNLRHRSFMEPVVRWIYSNYLKNNQQPSGMKSYDEVTAFLIAYYKKYGYI